MPNGNAINAPVITIIIGEDMLRRCSLRDCRP
jgi:hypothetical protein